MKFKREHKLKLISVLLALTLWYFVVLGKPIEKDLEIPITWKGFNNNYLVEVNPSDIILKVETTRRVLRTFPNENLKLEIDLSRYSPGVYQIRVPIEKLKLPSDVKVKEISPTSITLVIKKISTKKIPVKLVFETEENFPKKFKITINPSYVTVRAPVDVLASIDHVPVKPLNIVKLKLEKEIVAELLPPSDILSVYPKKVTVIYQEKGGH